MDYIPPPAIQEVVIKNDFGGFFDIYKDRYNSYNNVSIKIDGVCASACTLFFMINTNKVCITKNVKLGFHLATKVKRTGLVWTASIDTNKSNEMLGYYPTWLVDIINAKGGLSEQPIWLSFDDLKGHMETCPQLA